MAVTESLDIMPSKHGSQRGSGPIANWTWLSASLWSLMLAGQICQWAPGPNTCWTRRCESQDLIFSGCVYQQVSWSYVCLTQLTASLWSLRLLSRLSASLETSRLLDTAVTRPLAPTLAGRGCQRVFGPHVYWTQLSANLWASCLLTAVSE
jgi:hypothetical protein